MSQIFDFLFSQYASYAPFDIVLEILAFVFTLASVLYSKQNNVLVFPSGMVSTAIFVYLLYKWELLGDMLINAYYFCMSIYGWYVWTRKDAKSSATPISKTSPAEHKQSVILFFATIIFVWCIYMIFNKFGHWTTYLDLFTTALFFVGMWLMAKRKIENWLYWIVGDIVTVPLYFYKGLTFSSILYFVLTIIAVFGYLTWKKNLDRLPVAV